MLIRSELRKAGKIGKMLEDFLRKLYDFDYIIVLLLLTFVLPFLDPFLEKLSREELLFLSRLLIAVIIAIIYLHIFKAKFIDGD